MGAKAQAHADWWNEQNVVRSPDTSNAKALPLVRVKGSAFVNASHHRMIEKYSDEGSGFPDVAGIVDSYGKPAGFCISPIEHFIDCVVNDKNPSVTGEDGLEAARVIMAMEESAKTGLPVVSLS